MKVLKRLLVVSVLLLYIGIVFRPAIFSGKLPIPADLVVGMYHPWRDFFANEYPNGIPFKNFLISDPVRQLYPWRELSISLLKSGQLPGWNPYSFAGYPLSANFQSAPFYPLNILYLFGDFSVIWSIQVVLQLIFGFLFMYYFLRKGLELEKISSSFGSISWIGCGFFVAWLEWNSVIQTIIWLPLILLAINQIFRNVNIKKWIIILSLSLICNLLAGHLQSAFYCWAVAGMYTVFLSFSNRNYKKLLLVFAVFLVSILLISWWLVPSIQLILNSSRSIDQAIWDKPDWFIPWQHAVQFVAPDFFGNPATQNYFGVWNYAEFVGYIGILPLLLSIIGVAISFKRQRFFVILLLVSGLFAFPTFLAKIPFQLNVPLLSTSQPSRIISIIDFCLVIFAAVGFEYFFKNKLNRKILICIIFLALLILGLWIYAYQSHLSISLRNLFLPTIFFISGSALLFFRKVGLILVLLLTVIDLSLFSQKFTSFSPNSWLYPETKILKYLTAENKKDVFRIAPVNGIIMSPNFSTEYRLQSISGYDPLYLERYAELVVAYNRNKPDILPPFGFNRAIAPENITSPLFKLLNVKYVLSIDNVPYDGYELIMQEGLTKLYRNNRTLPRAYLVGNTISAINKQDSIKKLMDLGFGLENIAVVEGPKNLSISGGVAKILKYTENEIRVETYSTGLSFLVLLDISYPNWRVTVDGKPSTIYITDFAFRGVQVPAGKHEVKFSYSLL